MKVNGVVNLMARSSKERVSLWKQKLRLGEYSSNKARHHVRKHATHFSHQLRGSSRIGKCVKQHPLHCLLKFSVSQIRYFVISRLHVMKRSDSYSVLSNSKTNPLKS